MYSHQDVRNSIKQAWATDTSDATQKWADFKATMNANMVYLKLTLI
jgi:hypothetical protein